MAQAGLEDVVETVEKTGIMRRMLLLKICKESAEQIEEESTDEPFVSAAEMFIQSDTDDDGTLSVEER